MLLLLLPLLFRGRVRGGCDACLEIGVSCDDEAWEMLKRVAVIRDGEDGLLPSVGAVRERGNGEDAQERGAREGGDEEEGVCDGVEGEAGERARGRGDGEAEQGGGRAGQRDEEQGAAHGGGRGRRRGERV